MYWMKKLLLPIKERKFNSQVCGVSLFIFFSLFVVQPSLSQTNFTILNGTTFQTLQLTGGQTGFVQLRGQGGVPKLLKGSIIAPAGATPEIRVKEFFRTNPTLYRINNPDAELQLRRKTVDDKGKSHIHFDQLYKGVPVFGNRLISHIAQDGTITAINGDFMPDLTLSVVPTLTKAEAVAAAQQHLGFSAKPAAHDSPSLFIYGPTAGSSRLVWKFSLSSEDPLTLMVYFIDANTGEVLNSYNNLQTLRYREIYERVYGDDETSTDELILAEGDTLNQDNYAQTTYDYSGTVYDYFANRFARDGWNCGDNDDNGIPGYPNCTAEVIKSVIRIVNDDYAGMWNGVYMSFTRSYGANMGVMAHEYTHGITYRTADLTYAFQSGALSESFSDVFGILLSRSINFLYWAEDRLPSGPTRMSQYLWPDDNTDGGGNHINDNIVTNAAFHVADDIGDETMAAIWYKALTEYLTLTSQFIDTREALILAAEDLHGAGSAAVASVIAAFDTVEINDAAPPLIGNMKPKGALPPEELDELYGEILDVSGSGLDLSTLQVRLDGAIVPGCTYSVNSFPTPVTATCPLGPGAVTLGGHTYDISIADNNGNTQTVSRDFRLGQEAVLYISEPGGADCSSVGLWDQPSLTCTLNKDVEIGDRIEIIGDNITLSGGSIEPYHEMNGWGGVAGITITGRTNVTIRNLLLHDFSKGIFLDGATGNTIENVSFESNTTGIFMQNTTSTSITNNVFSGDGTGVLLNNCNNNILQNNALSSAGTSYGFRVVSSNNNDIDDNDIDLFNGGIWLHGGSGNRVSGNIIGNSLNNGIYLSGVTTANSITGNTIQGSTLHGISINNASDNIVVSNNFIGNLMQASLVAGSGNIFTDTVKGYGNYWNDFDTSGEGCGDANHDGICDDAYTFSGSLDSFPLTSYVLARTMRIDAASQGGDCQRSAGTWSATDKTCSLSRDVMALGLDDAFVLNNGATLQGNEFTLLGTRFAAVGVSFDVTIQAYLKKLIIKGFATGIEASRGAKITDSTMINNTVGLRTVSGTSYSDPEVVGNVFKNNATGFSSTLAMTPVLRNNNFLGNIIQASIGVSTSTSQISNNHWSDFDEPSEGCNDPDMNGICNGSYQSGTDNSPRTTDYLNVASLQLRNDSTGGDCNKIGSWNWGTTTCTMTGDYTLPVPIEFAGNNISLEGSGHKIYSAPASNYAPCLSLDGRSGVTVSNLSFFNCRVGITVQGGSYNNILGNVIGPGASAGILLMNGPGGSSERAHHNIILGNTVSFRQEVYGAGGGLWLDGADNTVTGNLFADNIYGIHFGSVSGNFVYNNNFIDNNSQTHCASTNGLNGSYNLDAPVGGNYYSDFSATCADNNTDGFCDTPYPICGNNNYRDNLPWTAQGPWPGSVLGTPVVIRDDISGGDCSAVGSWDAPLKTCTLSRDLFFSSGSRGIQIANNDVVVDGGGHTINGTPSMTGIYLRDVSRVTVRNLTVQEFEVGIHVSHSSSGSAVDNRVEGNSILANSKYGIIVGGNRTVVHNNTIASHKATSDSIGIYLSSAVDSQIYNNNFLDNSIQAEVYFGSGNTFSEIARVGGNFWDDYDACEDANFDGYCDTPYSFTSPYGFGGSDTLPWAQQSAWLDTTPPTVSNVATHGVGGHQKAAYISAAFSDANTGIRSASMQIFIDGVPPANCSVTVTGLECTVFDLEYGPHVISGSIADYAGNTAAINGSFVEDIVTILNDATGGDCTKVGIWNDSSPPSRCTLDRDLQVGLSGILILADNIILDGANHTLTGNGTGRGITIVNQSGVTVKNMIIDNFENAVNSFLASGNIYEKIKAVNSTIDAFFFKFSSNNILVGNSFKNSGANGLLLTGNASEGSDNNTIYQNHFINNGAAQAKIVFGSGNLFNQAKPLGGNYWSDYDTGAEGCADTSPVDNFCDAPYIVNGALIPAVADQYPWTFAYDPNLDDLDGDGFVDALDKCPQLASPDNRDTDADGAADPCDDDADGDGIANEQDNCVLIVNTDQADADGDGYGDICEPRYYCVDPKGASLSFQEALDAAGQDNRHSIIQLIIGKYSVEANKTLAAFTYSFDEPFDLTIRGGYDGKNCQFWDNVPEKTIITGKIADETVKDRALVIVEDAVTPYKQVLISGLTIRDSSPVGDVDDYRFMGGGVYLHSVNGSILFDNNRVLSNTADSDGGGLHASTQYGLILLRNNILADNISASSRGGGAVLATGRFGHIDLTNNTMTGNQSPADQGSDLFLYLSGPAASAELYNNIIWQKLGEGSSEILVDKKKGGTMTAYNNDFGAVEPVDAFDTEINTIDVDPWLGEDPAKNSYHLPQASECIDQGFNPAPFLPGEDTDGEKRIVAGDYLSKPVVDIGADEYVKTCPGDIDFDHDVDGMDLVLFAGGHGGHLPLASFAVNFGRHDCP